MTVVIIFFIHGRDSYSGRRHPHCSNVSIHAWVDTYVTSINDSTTSLSVDGVESITIQMSRFQYHHGASFDIRRRYNGHQFQVDGERAMPLVIESLLVR